MNSTLSAVAVITQVSKRHKLPLSIANKQTLKQTLSDIVNFITKNHVVFFQEVYKTDFMNSLISGGMALPHITDASDFAIRKVSLNPNKEADYPL